MKGNAMHITLTPEQEKIVQERLKIGAYRTEQDVIDDALGRLVEDEIIESYDQDELRASLQRSREEFDRGEGIEIIDREAFVDDVLTRAEKRIEQRKRANKT